MKTWRDQIPLLIAGGIVSVAVAGTVAFGGRVMAGGETTAILNAQVQQLLDEVKEQHREDKDQRQLLQDMTVKLGDLYTRREAQEDRAASERRFQSMEGRIGELGRRLDALETNQRFLQQVIVDKSARRP